jgi:hypothetical protein
MEIVWSGIGFLIGMSLWLPFIVGARVEAKLVRLELGTPLASRHRR